MTDASSTLAFDTASLKWSDDIIEALGLDREKYPLCKNPQDISGEVTSKAASETGLLKGTPVVFGGGDQPMQAIGNGIVLPGIVSSTIGTGGQIFTPIDKPLYDKALRTHTFCNAMPGTWNIMGASLSAGLSLQWLRDNILTGTDFKTMDNEAEKLPAGSDGLIFLPYLIGERTPHMDPYARGLFFGLTLKTTRFNMARAVMEGVVYALRDSIDIFDSLGIQMKNIIASGGGAKSRLWVRMQADIFGREVKISKVAEQACMGAAITAGVGLSVYSSFESVCRDLIKYDSEVIYPDDRNTKIYNHYYNIYKSLYIRNKDLYKEISK
jgi:xylulokinase